MRIGWVGFHVEGLPALRAVLEQGIRLEAVMTLKPQLAAKRSGSTDYAEICHEFAVPLYEIANINDDESLELLRKLSLDLVFVIGWSQIVRAEALRAVRRGMIGAHASLLPRHRGRAPINWALIKGLKETGNSLIWLVEGVDRGDIIDQMPIPITPYDTCASLYDKVAETNKEMILRVIPQLAAGKRPGRPQLAADEDALLPGRRPEDGLLDWSQKSIDVYNFIRGITRPYPGAFSWLDGERWSVWQCSLLPNFENHGARPGQILGPVVSPIEGACGQAVACGGGGAVILLEVESESAGVLSGRQLSEQMWEGKWWRNE